MGTVTLKVDEQLYHRADQHREELNYSWEAAFDLMRCALRAENPTGVDDDRPSDTDVADALVRRVEGDVPRSEIAVISRGELDQRISDARESGYEEGYEEALDIIPSEKRADVVKQAAEGALLSKGVCRRCRISDADSIHHLVPRSESGADTLKNKIPLCQECHDRVEILTLKLLNGSDVSPKRLREYVEDGFPIRVYE